MCIHFAVLRVILFVALATWCSFAEAQKIVKRVMIHSSLSGLEGGTNTLVVIKRKGGKFLSNTRVVEWTWERGKLLKFLSTGRPVSAGQVQVLAAALSAPPLTEPDMRNLGITGITASQEKLFHNSFENAVLGNLLLTSEVTDTYTLCKVEIVFDDGSKLSANAGALGYTAFMLPWDMKGRLTYNADISRAVASLLPDGSIGKSTLEGDKLATDLAREVMISVEREEVRTGEALNMLRMVYDVVAASVTPYLDREYEIHSSEPKEMYLHAAVRKSNFPSNVTDALVLHYVNEKVEGVDEFLESAAKYEDLALSVPWLNDFIRDNPQAAVRISYIHDKSFGDKDMRGFTADMKLLGREDLIEQVKSQQADIALLVIKETDTESYWLLFPDKHMMLWRYAGPSRLLKWTPKDFHRGCRCSDHLGFCSGREITEDGMLAPETPPPRCHRG